MTSQLTSRDFELLSTYLDGQLTGSERTRLESRLRADTELRTTLEDMRRTRAVLRAAPPLRAPRNYSLKPDMVRLSRRTPPAYPILRLASVLASLLFVLAFAGDLISRGTPAQAPVALVQEGAVANPAAVEEAAVTEQVLMQSKAPAESGAETGQESLADQAATGMADAPMLQMEMVAETPDATQVAVEQSPEMGDTLREAPETQSGQAAMQTEVEDQAETKTMTDLGGLNPLRALEVIALILAIATGLGAFYVRRNV